MISKLYKKEPVLVLVEKLIENASNVEAIDMITDGLAGMGLCRSRGDVSGLGALRIEATLHAMKRGCITEEKAAADLKRWGLM